MASDAAAGERRFKVYTKTGDKGTSSLYNGTRASKTDAVFAALGDTDELNAAIGLAREHCAELSDVGSLVNQLVVIQSRLLDAGSAIATPTSSSSEAQLERVTFDEAHVEVLEEWIDEMDETLPPLKNFILPSGGLAAAHLHVARVTCRRAERSIVQLVQSGDAPAVVQRFLNRLSDYFFVAARFAAAKSGHAEQVYKKGVGLTGSSAEARAAVRAAKA